MQTPAIFKSILTTAVTCLALVSVAQAQVVSGQGTWEATLLGRNSQLQAVSATDASAVYLYDSTLGVTWLRNANTNGQMNWTSANAWAANLVTGSGATAIGDWRLPIMADNPNPTYSYNGSTAQGENVPASSSEMASLFFDTLGNLSYLDTLGNSPQPGWGLTNVGSFQNLLARVYWLDLSYGPYTAYAWSFNNSLGNQYARDKTISTYYAMAVRAGDVLLPVSSVPEPDSYALLLAGLGLMGTVARRRKAKQQA